MIMTSLEDRVVEGFVIGGIDVTLVGEDTCFDLPVGKAGVEWEWNILIYGLEGLEVEGVAGGGRFNMVGEGYVDDIDEKGWRKESDSIIVIVRMREKIQVMGEGIRACPELSRDMDHFQVEVGKVDKPSGLLTIEGLGGTEVGEVFVVGKDLYREWGSLEVVTPGFQGSNDGKEFPVVDVVVSFCWGEWLGKVGARVPIAIRVGLEEDCAGGVLEGVGCNGEGGGKVWEMEDWLGQEEGFESVK